MLGALPYLPDQLLNKRLFKRIVQLLFSHQRRALFEKRSRAVFHLGSRQSLESKYTGMRCYKPSRAILIQSPQSPSPPTASRSCLGLRIGPSGAGTRLRESSCCRPSRAILIQSPQSPSPPTASISQ